ncbi:diguanylate cyclase [Pannus brasiliensis CCIBt3594]|uniref:Diguanylate cyclase n=1 Tax=Pannus brasiliensis CCIBt3594 TaxID=1427578 RepID=A0AAW9QQL5_9CHRO
MIDSLMKADILIADGNSSEMSLLSNFLRQQGHTTRQVFDGEMALTAIHTRKPDLVLTDANLPRLDGYRLCQQLREKPATSEIPLIFLLDAGDRMARVKALEVGGNDYLIKPYDLEESRLKVSYQLKLQRERQQLRQEVRELRQSSHLAELANRSGENSQEFLELLSVAISTIHNGVVITDATHPDRPVVYVNPGFEKMTGYSFEEVVGKNCRFLQGSDRDQSELDHLRRSIESGQACRITLRNYRKDGTLFWNEISLSPILDENGRAIYFIGIQTDVTDRKRAEEELQRSRAAVGQMNRELYRLNDRLHRLANLDGLTGVANRRCFDERFTREWQRLTRDRQPLSLILGDIDYFKRYNDTYGHLYGDDCLKAVARALRNSVHRPADLVARCGGEEFAVILPNTDIAGARQVALAIRRSIENLQIPHRSSDVSPWVTMSLGVATEIPTPDRHPKDLLGSADRALFLAKERGRNQVAIEEREPSG